MVSALIGKRWLCQRARNPETVLIRAAFPRGFTREPANWTFCVRVIIEPLRGTITEKTVTVTTVNNKGSVWT